MTGASSSSPAAFDGLARLGGADMIAAALDAFPRRVAIVSSFGTESAVLLHLAARVDKSIPVIFMDTEKLFGQTRSYQKHLTAHLGLTGVRTYGPEAADLNVEDPSGTLWQSDPDRCCTVRKTWPLDRALAPFDAWISGRKRFQSPEREWASPVAEQNGKFVLSPLLNWSKDDLNAYFDAHDLPRHPLEAAGFPSVGCYTCTSPVQEGEHIRAGRWRGRDKTECGIHRGGSFRPAFAMGHGR